MNTNTLTDRQPWYKRLFTLDFILYALISLALWVVVLLIFGYPPSHHATYDEYTRQALSWQKGRADIENGAELGNSYLELAPFKGKWYVSFPPAPTLIEFPFSLIFGLNTPSTYTLVFFTWLGMLFSFFILLKFTENRLLSYVLAFAFFWGSNIFYLSLEGRVWHQGQLYGVFFALFAFLILVYCNKSVHLILGALLLGLAVGCRPFYLFVAPFYMYYGFKRFPQFKTLLFIGMGLTPPGLFYAIYNQLRFGEFWQFGHQYLPWEMDQIPLGGTYNFNNFLSNVYKDFIQFPFFDPQTGLINFKGDGTAIWIVSPIILIGFVYFFKRDIPVLEKIIGGVCLVAIWIPLLMHGSNGWFQFGYRFSVDLIPLLLFFTARTFRKNHIFFIPLAVYSIIVNMYGAILFYAT